MENYANKIGSLVVEESLSTLDMVIHKVKEGYMSVRAASVALGMSMENVQNIAFGEIIL